MEGKKKKKKIVSSRVPEQEEHNLFHYQEIVDTSF